MGSMDRSPQDIHRRKRERRRREEKPVPGSEPDAPGRQADSPWRIPPRGWWEILKRTRSELEQDHISLLAAGSAYYAMLSIFPALIAVVTIYGLIANPRDVENILSTAASVIPDNVLEVLRDQLTAIVTGSAQSLGLGLIVSVAGLFWSASSGTSALIESVNIAYDEIESRSYLRMKILSLSFAVGAILFVIVAVAVIAILPVVTSYFGIGRWAIWLRWPALALMIIMAVGLVFRYAPDRNPPRWHWLSWGAVIASVFWLAGSFAFSLYISHFGNYNKTYGTLGAVIVLLLWLYLSSYVILLGAEINSEMEHQTERDTTVGPPLPMGQRGAWVADHLPGQEEKRPFGGR